MSKQLEVTTRITSVGEDGFIYIEMTFSGAKRYLGPLLEGLFYHPNFRPGSSGRMSSASGGGVDDRDRPSDRTTFKGGISAGFSKLQDARDWIDDTASAVKRFDSEADPLLNQFRALEGKRNL